MKNCAFQYATLDGCILANTTLITQEQAEQLWEDHIDTFKKHIAEGRNHEMTIWCNMENKDEYHTTSKHWDASKMVIHDGKIYSCIE